MLASVDTAVDSAIRAVGENVLHVEFGEVDLPFVHRSFCGCGGLGGSRGGGGGMAHVQIPFTEIKSIRPEVLTSSSAPAPDSP